MRKNGTPDLATENVRNDTRPKTVLTDTSGQVQTDVPRDRAGTSEPQPSSCSRTPSPKRRAQDSTEVADRR
jgi:transposase-like protein